MITTGQVSVRKDGVAWTLTNIGLIFVGGVALAMWKGGPQGQTATQELADLG